MALPMVAIVGRPNVGKSALLNMLVRQRVSIVDPMAGVTRDRVSAVCEADDRYFEVVDTGGYGIEDHDQLTEHVEDQIRLALSGAALVLFVVDIQQEVTPLDVETTRLLRSAEVPVLLVANKADSEKHDPLAGPFHALGFGSPLCVAALHGRNRRELIGRILESLGDSAPDESPAPVMKVACVGRRNVGKSTFINALAGQERVIVSEVPGTTRDSIDVRIEMDGRVLVVIDTAGVRKRRMVQPGVEFYSNLRTVGSIRRSDVVLFLIDATAPVGEVDKKLARLIVDEFKPCVVVVNKWDLAKGRASAEDYSSYLTKTIPSLAFAPIAFTTAATGRNVRVAIEAASGLFKQGQTRVTTGQLNRMVEDLLAARQPMGGRRGAAPRIYYATQISVRPPTIVFFVNNAALVRDQYRRYVEKRVRETLPFPEIPIRLLWRARKQDGAKAPRRARLTSKD